MSSNNAPQPQQSAEPAAADAESKLQPSELNAEPAKGGRRHRRKSGRKSARKSGRKSARKVHKKARKSARKSRKHRRR